MKPQAEQSASRFADYMYDIAYPHGPDRIDPLPVRVSRLVAHQLKLSGDTA
ncbi:hypothetical protein [Novacetimonas pomaceti]|uniref:hypothetical protein n=1 Tax=Novacetimonas pomaceti TaxID=2021998 RepID=UPI0014035B61|nr:hypothetical protein [Novacetimonas pomaceti]MBV1834796.1 hypothetical protein [Novacetimonas pomaceti]